MIHKIVPSDGIWLYYFKSIWLQDKITGTFQAEAYYDDLMSTESSMMLKTYAGNQAVFQFGVCFYRIVWIFF